MPREVRTPGYLALYMWRCLCRRNQHVGASCRPGSSRIAVLPAAAIVLVRVRIQRQGWVQREGRVEWLVDSEWNDAPGERRGAGTCRSLAPCAIRCARQVVLGYETGNAVLAALAADFLPPDPAAANMCAANSGNKYLVIPSLTRSNTEG